jgi:Helix-turn-helix domain
VVARPAVDCAARGSAAFLAGYRGRALDRRCGRGGGRIRAGRRPVVSRRWRDAADLVGSGVGAVVVVCRAEEIAILHAQHVGVRGIARQLGGSASTISRELRRNASTRSRAVVYRATTAQWHAERRASRPKVSKLAANDALRK